MRMVVFYGVVFSLNALASAIVASFLNVDWGTLTPTSQFLLVTVIVQNWLGTVLAFMNKTISRIEHGQPPIPTGETTFISKSTVDKPGPGGPSS